MLFAGLGPAKFDFRGARSHTLFRLYMYTIRTSRPANDIFFYDPVKFENRSHNRSHFCLRLPAKIQFLLDRKRQSPKHNRFRWFDFQTSYMSLYTSDYNSSYNSVAAENYPLEPDGFYKAPKAKPDYRNSIGSFQIKLETS